MRDTSGTPISADAHERWILERVSLLPCETVPIAQAYGRTVAADVRARHALPMWDSSAMDGYAVRHTDVSEATSNEPVSLRVVGEVLAGSADDPRIAAGETVRIMTGAPIPTAADTVVRVEETRGDHGESVWAEHTVQMLGAPIAGANIRRRGEDTPEQHVLAEAGSHVGSSRLSAIAAGGVSEIPVRRVPRVAVVATGSELRAPGERLSRGQIPESNSLLITGLLREVGIEPTTVRINRDDVSAFAGELHELAPLVDVIITTGGVGPGTHDVVRIALDSEPEVCAVRVAVRPGQPQCTGRLAGGAFIFALPGNPVSAAVSFELFVRPALLAMQGRTPRHRLRHDATAVVGWRGTLGRLQVLPVRVTQATGLECRPAVNPRGVSHAVGGHGDANGYAIIEEARGDVSAGETVPVIMVTQ